MSALSKRNTELRELDLPALVNELAEAKDRAFKLRFQSAVGQLENNAELRKARREIARLNTFIRQREIAAAEAREMK
jgi:large subunit ribosomal protein L29